MRTQAENPQDKENINILNIHKHPEKNSLPSLSKLKITKAKQETQHKGQKRSFSSYLNDIQENRFFQHGQKKRHDK